MRLRRRQLEETHDDSCPSTNSLRCAKIKPAILPRPRDLEGNIVVHVVELARGLLRGLALGHSHGRLVLVAAVARRRVARALPAAEHLHALGDDLGGIALLAFLVLPLACAQGPLDVDLRALLQVFARDLGEAGERYPAGPLRGVLSLLPPLFL